MTIGVFSVGHSTRTAEQLVSVLADGFVKTVVDVRRYPHSRRQPWFNVDQLKRVLFKAGIKYVWLGHELGGFRDAHVDSPNTSLAGSSFQGYADHMSSPAFAAGYGRLLQEARSAATAVLCSERNPKKCHRHLLADRLASDGHQVVHLLGVGERMPHRLSPKTRSDASGGLVYQVPSLDDFPA